MTPEEQGTRNIVLLGRHLLHLLDHPEDLEEVAGREVVLIPVDDPELAAANEQLAVGFEAKNPHAAGMEPVSLVRA